MQDLQYHVSTNQIPNANPALIIIQMTQPRDRSAIRHLPGFYNKRNYCIHVQVYLFVRVHMHLSIGLTVTHI